MKKIKLNTAKLQLNKEKITELNNQEMNQVNGGFTGGCTDGCGPFHSKWNCTRQDCTADCPVMSSKVVCPQTDY